MSSKLELNLMLIDSDSDSLFLLKTLMELTGCHVQTAQSYTEAFSLIERNIPDVIFTELFLEQMSLLEVSKRFRSLDPSHRTSLIALTGHYYNGIPQDARTSGFDRFLLKPVQYDQILVILRDTARIRQGNASGSAAFPRAAA